MNKVFFIGNLTKDPEYGTTSKGISHCKFNIAVQRNYANADGERDVDFFNCIAWRYTADYCKKYLSKGKRVAIEGRLETNSYEAQDGTTRHNYNVVIDNIEMMFTRSENAPIEQKPTASIDDDDLPF